MNAITTTFGDLSKALAKAATPVPCVGDVVKWCQEQERNPYPHFGWALHRATGATAFMPLSEAKALLGRALEQERSLQARKHWAADLNLLIAIKQMQALIASFEGYLHQREMEGA